MQSFLGESVLWMGCSFGFRRMLGDQIVQPPIQNANIPIVCMHMWPDIAYVVRPFFVLCPALRPDIYFRIHIPPKIVPKALLSHIDFTDIFMGRQSQTTESSHQTSLFSFSNHSYLNWLFLISFHSLSPTLLSMPSIIPINKLSASSTSKTKPQSWWNGPWGGS